jgi:hypothetical protein
MAGGERVIHHVPEAGGDAHERLTRIADGGRDDGERSEEHEHGREKAQRATAVEGREGDDACASALVEQEAGDQEARENEEEVDSEQTGRGEREVGRVIEDDRSDRDCAESVERWRVFEWQISPPWLAPNESEAPTGDFSPELEWF